MCPHGIRFKYALEFLQLSRFCQCALSRKSGPHSQTQMCIGQQNCTVMCFYTLCIIMALAIWSCCCWHACFSLVYPKYVCSDNIFRGRISIGTSAGNVGVLYSIKFSSEGECSNDGSYRVCIKTACTCEDDVINGIHLSQKPTP